MRLGVAALQAQLPKREEKQRNNLAHSPLCSLLNMLDTAQSHVSDQTAQEGPEEKPWAHQADRDKNLK